MSYNSMITLQLTQLLICLFELLWNSWRTFIVMFFFLTNWYYLLVVALSIISCKFSEFKVFTNYTMMIKAIPTFITNSRLGSLSSFNYGKHKLLLQCCCNVASMLLHHFNDLIYSQALDMRTRIVITSFISKAYIL